MKPSPAPASPLTFLALTFALSVPWWGLSFFIRTPGLPDQLPITDAGAAFMPALAAIILTYRQRGGQGVRDLLQRLTDWNRIPGLWRPILLGLPLLLYVLTYVGMGLAGLGPSDPWEIGPHLMLIFCIFILGAIGEELGYTGYATDPLLRRTTAWMAGVILGVPWAVWHMPSMLQTGQSAELILWGLAATVAYRVIYVEIYIRTGRSLFAITLLHALLNTGRSAFPGGREGFEAGNAIVGYGLVIILAVCLILLWRSKQET